MIDFEVFLNWAESRFDGVLVAGKEIKVNSIFTEDRKHHLWMCPSKGVYHCWKTDEKGSLVKLVSLVDHCTQKEAGEKIGAGGLGSIWQLEKELLEIEENVKEDKRRIELPPNTYSILSLSKNNHYRIYAESYLKSRKLPCSNLMICTEGKYKDRIIIPYYSRKNELIYWNSRDLTNKARLRYWGPTKDEFGVGKSDVLYFEKYPDINSRVYLTEGEFDAMSLNMTGLCGVACGGKCVSETQLKMLKNYKFTISFDADKGGADGLNKLGKILDSFTDLQVNYVRPPSIYKDWNDMLKDAGPRVIRLYIQENEKPFLGSWTVNKLLLNSF